MGQAVLTCACSVQVPSQVLGSCDLALMSLLPSARSGGMSSACCRLWGPAGPSRGKLDFRFIELSVVAQACS